MNATTLVYTHKPFIVTRSMIMVYVISKQLSESSHWRDGVVIRCDKKTISRANELGGGKFSRRSLTQLEMNLLQGLDLEGLDQTDHEFDYFHCNRDKLDISGNRLSNLGRNLTGLFKKLVDLDISQNEMTSLNEPLLRECVNLVALKMLRSFQPDTQFNLSFVSSLKKLRTLELTLPQPPWDLSSLQRLNHLVLEGISSVDANKKRAKFTNESFQQLSTKLFMLSLSHFEIECIDEETFKGFDRLRELNLVNNRISQIKQRAFDTLPLQLARMNLSTNQIEQLEEDSFKGLFELRALSLRTNVISQLSQHCFRGLEMLSKLDLSRNRLDQLLTEAFSSLINLTTLDLSHNRIDHLQSEALSSLVNLTKLDLSNNSIQQINSDSFPRLEKLRELILDDNPIKKIQANAFANLSALSSLSLRSCMLRSVSNETFQSLKFLATLLLDGNQISSFNVVTKDSIQIINRIMSPAVVEAVGEHLFREWNGRWHTMGLKVLSLKNNRLEKLDLRVFCNLVQLEDLDLSFNKINELNTANMPRNLSKLTSLNLQSNQLKFIDPNAFIGLKSLKNLNLSNNKLETLEAHFFQFSRVLKCVHLQKNNLKMTIDANTFPGSFELINEIYLQENPLVSIKDDAFSGMKGLNRLSFDLTTSFVGLPDQSESVSSSCSSFDYFEYCGLEPNYEKPFTQLSLHRSDQTTIEQFLHSLDNQKSFAKITHLAMPSCRIGSLDNLRLGQWFPCLLKLDLSHNLIEAIQSDWFDSMPKLWDLNLAGNNLTILENPDVFTSLANVRSINLSGNKLKHLHPQVFRGRSELESLNLSKNGQLSDIPDDLFRGLHKMKEINLDGNGICRLNLTTILKTCKLVEVLNLSNNKLNERTINKQTISLAFHLKELGLAGNLISSCEFIESLTKLEKLDLSDNQINALAIDGRNLFGRLMSLQRLNLQGNPIKSIDENTFSHLSPETFSLII